VVRRPIAITELTRENLLDYEDGIYPQLDHVTAKQVRDIQVTLYSQSIPPFYLQQRFADASTGAAESDDIERLYYMTSHMDVNAIRNGQSEPLLTEWKLFIGKAECRLNK
jgi:hypothetical protein